MKMKNRCGRDSGLKFIYPSIYLFTLDAHQWDKQTLIKFHVNAFGIHTGYRILLEGLKRNSVHIWR